MSLTVSPPAAGFLRLYRLGPLPHECRLLVRQRFLSDWLLEAIKDAGIENAYGRWFTSDRAAVEWYSREHPSYPVRHVDVSADDALRWLAIAHPSARRFATEQQHEYFLPVEVADLAT